ncbi:MAG: hypothetical protein IPO35_15950 [Uliginosibacterium sp.]|nr:hypothetical protein [Uliginosibacterium sp.]
MAKVTHDKVIEPGLFEKEIDNAQKFHGELVQLTKDFASVLDASAKAGKGLNMSLFDDMKEFERTIQENNKNWLVFNELIKKTQELENKLAEMRANHAQSELAREARAEANKARQAARELERQAKAEEKAKEKAKRDADRDAKRKKALADMTDDEIKAEIIRKRQDEARIKRLKDEAIMLDDQAGAIEKLVARNRQLARERDSMTDIYSDEAKEKIKAINDEINANNEVISENSDKLKQQKMNVGNYTDSILAALNSTNSFGSSIDGLSAITSKFSPAIGLLTAGIEKYTAWLEKAKEESEKTGKEVTRTGKIFRGIKIGIGSLAVGAAGGIATAFASTRAGGEVLASTMKKLEMSFGLLSQIALEKMGLIKVEVENVGNELDKALSKKAELENRLYEAAKSPLSEFETPELRKEKIKKIVEELGNYAKKVKELEDSGMKPIAKTAETLAEKLVSVWTGKAADAIDAYTKSMNDLLTLTGDYAIQLAKLGAQVAYLDMIEGDNTESLTKRAAAMKKAGEETLKMARLTKELNEGTLKTTATNLFLSDQANTVKIFDKFGVTATNASTKIRELYENNKAFRDKLMAKADPARLNEFQNSLAALYTAEGEYSAKVRDLKNKQRQADQDSLEVDADIIQDTYAKKLTLIEQEVSDIRVATSEKKRLYDLANDQLKKTQAKTAEIFADPKLAGSQNKEAIMKLVKIEDLETLRLAIRELEKSEIIEDRLRQHVEDYGDNIEAVLEMKKQIKEEDARILTLEQETAMLSKQASEIAMLRATGLLTSEEYQKGVSDIEEKYAQIAFDNKKASLEAELLLVSTKSEREAQIKNELAKMEIELEKKKTEATIKELEKQDKAKAESAEKENEQQAKRKKTVEESAAAVKAFEDALFEALKKQNEERANAEIEASQKKQARLEQLADKGVEKAGENLIKQEEQTEKLKQKKEENQRKLLAIQSLTAILTAYAANAANGEKNPATKTAGDAIVLKQAAQFIVGSFEKGTDNTGVISGGGIDGKNGRLAIIHNNEKIFNSTHTSALEGAKNSEVVARFQMSYQLEAQNGKLLGEVARLTKAVENKSEYMGADIDNLADAVSIRMRKGNTMITRMQKNSPLL